MDLLRGQADKDDPPPGQERAPAATDSEDEAPDSLSGKMGGLLNRALDQSTSGSRAELFHWLLDQLVADEARILGALSDG